MFFLFKKLFWKLYQRKLSRPLNQSKNKLIWKYLGFLHQIKKLRFNCFNPFCLWILLIIGKNFSSYLWILIQELARFLIQFTSAVFYESDFGHSKMIATPYSFRLWSSICDKVSIILLRYAVAMCVDYIEKGL